MRFSKSKTKGTILFGVAVTLTLFTGYSYGVDNEKPKVPTKYMIENAETFKRGPFKGINPAKLNDKAGAFIYAANTDFVLLLDDKNPMFAVQDGSSYTDGGTVNYKGKGYTVTYLSSFSHVAGVRGMILGVSLSIEKEYVHYGIRTLAETRWIPTPLLDMPVPGLVPRAPKKKTAKGKIK